MLKTGEINNCLNCHSAYSTYDVKNEKDSNLIEYWSTIPYKENGIMKEPKGVCQFCNPKSIYFISKYETKTN